MPEYGAMPQDLGTFHPDWHEYMHYLYLPVVMPEVSDLRLPPNLAFAESLVDAVWDSAPEGSYIYVTARRGYASPGNPLNRPGWHADGFGSAGDLNYIWSDRWPTRFATGEFRAISTDHIVSAQQFTEQIEDSIRGPIPGLIKVWDAEPEVVYRLDPSVVHSTPIIDAPGGDRSFLKVSVSPNRYNLLGNSHNYLFEYEWEMFLRGEIRNDPAYAGGDIGPQA